MDVVRFIEKLADRLEGVGRRIRARTKLRSEIYNQVSREAVAEMRSGWRLTAVDMRKTLRNIHLETKRRMKLTDNQGKEGGSHG